MDAARSGRRITKSKIMARIHATTSTEAWTPTERHLDVPLRRGSAEMSPPSAKENSGVQNLLRSPAQYRPGRCGITHVDRAKSEALINILWIGVTTNPTAQWLAHQITETFHGTRPDLLIRDNDCAYGEVFARRDRSMGIRDRPIAPRSPWRNGYVERAIGSIRRECLDHMIVWSEAHGPSSAPPEGIHFL